jgi:hypothetical protein
LCSLNAVKHVGSLNEFMRVKLASKWDLLGTFCIEEKQTDASGSADMAKSVGKCFLEGTVPCHQSNQTLFEAPQITLCFSPRKTMCLHFWMVFQDCDPGDAYQSVAPCVGGI